MKAFQDRLFMMLHFILCSMRIIRKRGTLFCGDRMLTTWI